MITKGAQRQPGSKNSLKSGKCVWGKQEFYSLVGVVVVEQSPKKRHSWGLLVVAGCCCCCFFAPSPHIVVVIIARCDHQAARAGQAAPPANDDGERDTPREGEEQHQERMIQEDPMPGNRSACPGNCDRGRIESLQCVSSFLFSPGYRCWRRMLLR